jgi:YegS/Rv2252/BmrU family lipid kinase
VNNEGKKVLFIINRFSGTGFQPQVEGRMIDVCRAHDTECTIEYTKSRGHATELARQASANNFDFVVAVGGDGTVNEVAQGLIGTNLPMGIIPKGSGNGLARHLGIPISVPLSLARLFESNVVAMDTFTVNGKLSLNVSGIGLDGHIANLFGETVKRGLGGYVKLTVNEFFQFKEFEAQLRIGSETITRTAFVMAIANSSQYGNNARIAPLASVCDGVLHISVLKKVPAYRLDFVYSFFTGRIHRSDYCEVLEAKNLIITTNKSMAYHVDGEPSGVADRFEIKLQPGNLKMLVPKNAGKV